MSRNKCQRCLRSIHKPPFISLSYVNGDAHIWNYLSGECRIVENKGARACSYVSLQITEDAIYCIKKGIVAKLDIQTLEVLDETKNIMADNLYAHEDRLYISADSEFFVYDANDLKKKPLICPFWGSQRWSFKNSPLPFGNTICHVYDLNEGSCMGIGAINMKDGRKISLFQEQASWEGAPPCIHSLALQEDRIFIGREEGKIHIMDFGFSVYIQQMNKAIENKDWTALQTIYGTLSLDRKRRLDEIALEQTSASDSLVPDCTFTNLLEKGSQCVARKGQAAYFLMVCKVLDQVCKN